MPPLSPQTDDFAFASRRPGRRTILGWFFVVVFAVSIAGALVLYTLLPAPDSFVSTRVEIDTGASAADISRLLAEKDIVRSSVVLYSVLVTQYDPSQLKAGVFEFDAPEDVFAVAARVASTVPQAAQVRVTFPEGFTHFEFLKLLPDTIRDDSATAEDFAAYEGRLFPDTYFVDASFAPEDVAEVMLETFEEKIEPLRPVIADSSFTEDEVIILASIIEREANDIESMGMVSGILQNRLSLDMPLQVDASVAYGAGISGTELTREELQADGPYNTYTRTGLPPAAIANPGLQAITAVLEPIPSDYLYYITGDDGNFYYAKDLETHNANVQRYL